MYLDLRGHVKGQIPPKPGPTPPADDDCPRCQGTGVIIGPSKTVDCPACNGTGKKRR